MRNVFITLSIVAWISLFGQRPEPAPPQEKPIVLWNVNVFPVNGKDSVLKGYALRFDSGIITFIKPISEVGAVDTAETIVLYELAGKNVYPSIIAMNTIVGLTDIDAVRPTHDFAETGMFTPEVRAIIAYNTDSRIIPTLRINGVLLVQTVPRRGIITGRSAVVQLDAWNWEDASVKPISGMHVFYPSLYQHRGWWGSPVPPKYNKKQNEQLDELKTFVEESYAYCQNKPDHYPNIGYEAMCPVFKGEVPLFVHAWYSRDIMEAVEWFSKWDSIRLVVVTGADVVRIIPELKKRSIPVVYTAVHSLPLYEDNEPFFPSQVPSILADSGILFSLTFGSSWEVRNLPYVAGTAVARGLPYLKALEAITIKPAKILGIDDKYGSLEVGKSATLIVTEGDILNIPKSRVVKAFIDGRDVKLESHQTVLYERYVKKYGLDKQRN
ncbi:MAG: amidohydrolase family protein [Chlorobi bacterium]|nr:amidohydrolase family protein [Chlorobiota bacterium]